MQDIRPEVSLSPNAELRFSSIVETIVLIRLDVFMKFSHWKEKFRLLLLIYRLLEIYIWCYGGCPWDESNDYRSTEDQRDECTGKDCPRIVPRVTELALEKICFLSLDQGWYLYFLKISVQNSLKSLDSYFSIVTQRFHFWYYSGISKMTSCGQDSQYFHCSETNLLFSFFVISSCNLGIWFKCF